LSTPANVLFTDGQQAAEGVMVRTHGNATLDERVARLERRLAATIDQVELLGAAEGRGATARLERGPQALPGAGLAGRASRDPVLESLGTSAAGVRRKRRDGVPPGRAGVPPGRAGVPPGRAGVPPGRAGVPPGRAGVPPGRAGVPPGRAPVAAIGDATIARPWDAGALSDLVGGRVLAWIGGLAVVLAIILFLGLAISHGWIDEPARVMLAGIASIALLVGGVWLHGHRGRTEAARTMVGAGTAGLFATLTVAGTLYSLVAPLVCVAGALVVGAVATNLAIRWAGRAIAALGLGGALLAPVLVGAPPGIATLAMLGVAGAYAMTVAVRENWQWLGLGTVVACAPQWAGWALRTRPGVLEFAVVAGFAVLGVAGGVGAELVRVIAGRGAARSAHPADTASGAAASVVLVCLNACVAALVGYVGLSRSAGHKAAVLWLVALAALHAGVGLAPALAALSGRTRTLLVGIGLLLADVAFGLSAHGIVLTLGWALVSVVFAWRVRRTATALGPLEAGLGAHIALVLIGVVLAAPPDSLASHAGGLVALLSVATLAASSLASAALCSRERPAARALTVLGLASIAYLTADALGGAALAAAWALEGLALIRLSREGDGDDTAWLGGLAFLGLAGAHALIVDAPPTALVNGIDHLFPGVIALTTIGGAALVGGRRYAPASFQRRGLLGACAVTALYLASIAVVSAVEHGAAVAGHAVFDLSVRQQAQVALSALWSLVGLAALTLGLRQRLTAVRIGGLALLLVAVGKVFTYDLSALDSIYRVGSVLTVGLLLLAAALTYQRLRPPPAA
jgi:uncharacterized membrane protein